MPRGSSTLATAGAWLACAALLPSAHAGAGIRVPASGLGASACRQIPLESIPTNDATSRTASLKAIWRAFNRGGVVLHALENNAMRATNAHSGASSLLRYDLPAAIWKGGRQLRSWNEFFLEGKMRGKVPGPPRLLFDAFYVTSMVVGYYFLRHSAPRRRPAFPADAWCCAGYGVKDWQNIDLGNSRPTKHKKEVSPSRLTLVSGTPPTEPS